MTEQEEEFVHFVSSIDRLNHAWKILNDVRDQKDHPLAGPAFRFALVQYATPYVVSYGSELGANGKPLKKYSLDQKYIPPPRLQLHNRLIEARKSIHAHDDLSVKEAKLFVTQMEHGRFVHTLENVIHGTEEMANIDEIICLIEETLQNMYLDRDQREQQLPVNS